MAILLSNFVSEKLSFIHFKKTVEDQSNILEKDHLRVSIEKNESSQLSVWRDRLAIISLEI